MVHIVADFQTVYGRWMAHQNPLASDQPGRTMLQVLGMLACSGLIWRITLKP